MSLWRATIDAGYLLAGLNISPLSHHGKYPALLRDNSYDLVSKKPELSMCRIKGTGDRHYYRPVADRHN